MTATPREPGESRGRLLDAIARKPVDCTPVWFMRQAGRYQASYRELRKKHSILEICRTPELAAQVTMLPVKELPGLDAAIIFSDILVVPQAMGIQVEFIQSEGPQIMNPVKTVAEAEALKIVEPERDLKFVLDAIRLCKRELKIPLIGFAGGPFTLASYLIEGGSTKSFAKTKTVMVREPRLWAGLMGALTASVTRHLKAQFAAGCDVVQLFDSWVGVLAPNDYVDFVLPYTKQIFDGLHNVGPTIHFGTETGSLIELMQHADSTCLAVDWRTPLGEVFERTDRVSRSYEESAAHGEPDEDMRFVPRVSVMGNLDPTLLFAPRDFLLKRVDEVLGSAAGRPGHIFNLGHGILPETPIDNVIAVIEHVHSRTKR